jgi:predicted nuclease with TOPRIM domain
MAKKSKEITFTQEELTSLQELQQGYESVRNGLGALEVSRIQTEQRLETIENEKLRLETEYARLTQSEMDLVRELNEKYGPGNLDPNTGVFTPTK